MLLDSRIVLILTFLIGAIPFGWIFAKLWGVKDLRKVGSTNVGATNVVRSVGKMPGALTFLFDFLKGLLPMLLFECSHNNLCESANITVGLVAVFGHCFSPFLSFKGGKGVSTTLGVAFALNPWLGAASLLAYLLGLLMLRVSALGSLYAMLTFFSLTLVFRDDITEKMVVLGIVFLVLVRHRSNWTQLLEDDSSTQ